MLGERHDQLDHRNSTLEYLGFDPSTSSLLRTHASDCANTPGSADGPTVQRPRASFRKKKKKFKSWSIWVSIPVPRACEARTLPIAPIPLAGLASIGAPRARALQKQQKFKLRHGESNPGHLRDRQRCYQLHHDGCSSEPPARIELATLRLLSACSAN